MSIEPFRNGDRVVAYFSRVWVKFYVHLSQWHLYKRNGVFLWKTYGPSLDTFPLVTLFAKADMVALEEKAPAGKNLTFQEPPKSHLRKRCGLSLTQGSCSLA